MFEQAFVDHVGRTNRPWTVVASAAGQSIVVAGVILVTLLRTEALPRGFAHIGLPLVAPARLTPSVAAEPQRSAIRVARPALLTFPVITARQAGVTEIISQSDAPDLGGGSETGLPISDGLSRLGICIGCTGAVAPPPTSPKPTVTKPVENQTAATTRRVEIGGRVQAAKLIHQVKPAYPVLASSARISGTVRLEAIISREGAIQNLRLLSGHPLLTSAALDAVRQWRYQPTYLNGQPVEVITLIEVNFTLAR